MIDAKELPAVRAQAERKQSKDEGQVSSMVQTDLASQEMQLPARARPALALDRGRYYVVRHEK